MSLKITRQGILDTIQDGGRFGYQYLGINCNGAMDRFSARVANVLLGKEPDKPVIEMHFPSGEILFEKEAIVCLAGADFSPQINGHPVPLHHPFAVNKKTVLRMEKMNQGARCYLSLLNELRLDSWLGSYSTNLKAEAGGFQGRSLLKHDVLLFENGPRLSKLLKEQDFLLLPWKASETVDPKSEIEFLIGSEWHWLTKESQEVFQDQLFQITNEADRMGYRLAGPGLELKNDEQLVSSAVCFGTVQSLPGGQLIVLMADHQTAGGYPRIAYVISAHLPILAQKQPNDVLKFKMTSLEEAEKKLFNQKKYLKGLQIACKFRMEDFLNAHL